MREEEHQEQEVPVEDRTRDTISLDAHDLPPDLDELEPVSSSSAVFHKPIPIYASRRPSHSTSRPFSSASTGFPAQQAEGSELQVEVGEVQQEVNQLVEEDVKRGVDEDMQQHITIIIQKNFIPTITLQADVRS